MTTNQQEGPAPDWPKAKAARDERLQAGSKFARGKMVDPDDATALLEAVISPGDRLSREGDNQKQADFRARALVPIRGRRVARRLARSTAARCSSARSIPIPSCSGAISSP